MARDFGPVVKQSRREGYAVHPKAHKYLAKQATPGSQLQSSGRRNSTSQFAVQMREKQKVRRLYGLLEKQFRNLFKEASKTKGQTGEVTLILLERRLDNTIYRAGFASSRKAARQLTSHGHFMLNGRRVDIPSIRVSVGDKITARQKSANSGYFKSLDENSPKPSSLPSWLKVDRKNLSIEIVGLPSREDAEEDINEQLIVEYYSR